MARVEQQLTIQSPPSEVYAALTEAERLTRWFAEHAEVAAEEDRFDFWGRQTPEAPTREEGRHRLRALEPDTLVAFDWHLKGQETSVRIELTAEGGGTRLCLCHENLVDWVAGEFSVGDYWEATLENLRALLEGREVGYRHDFAATGRAEIRIGVEIDAGPTEVFDALVDPEQLIRYFPEQADFDARVGGAIDFHWGDTGPAEVREIEPARRLVYSWKLHDGAATVVHWELEDSDGSTRLTLVHSGFAQEDPGYWLGWADVANSLKNMLEVGPSWQRAKQVERDC